LEEVSKDTSVDQEVRRLKLADIVDLSKARIQSLLNEAQSAILAEREHAHKTAHGGF
jgi:hypothetical protein